MDEPSSLTRPWGLGDALVAVFLGYAGAILVSGALGMDASSPISQRFVANIPLWAALLAVPIVVTRQRGRGPVTDLRLAVRPVALLAVPLGGLAQLVIGWSYAPFVDRDRLEEPARELARVAQGTSGKVLLVAMTVVIAPVVEEVFYRGLVLRSLRRALTPPVAAVVCGLVFAVMHFQPLQLPGLAAFGTLVAALALWSGRLGPAVLAHLGFNLVALFVADVF